MSKKYFKIIAPIAICLASAATAVAASQLATTSKVAKAASSANSSVSNSSVTFTAGTDTTESTSITKQYIKIEIDNTTYQSLSANPYCLANGAVQSNFAIGYNDTTHYSINKVTITGSNLDDEGISITSGWSITQKSSDSLVLTINDATQPTPVSLHFAATYTAIYASQITIEYKTYSTVTIQSEDTNKGTVTGTSGKYAEGNTIAVTATAKSGYTFKGWYKNEVQVSTSSSYTYTVDNTATVTLEARFTANQYNITYLDQGGSAFSGTHVSGYPTTHTYGTATSLKGATKTGYTFGGWFTTKECTGSAVSTLTATGYTSNITLYAKWTADSYNINYFDKGGSAFSGTHVSGYPTTHTYGTATTLDKPTKTGYVFKGWFKESDCSGTVLTQLGATSYTAAITLYALWNEAWTVSFNMHGHGTAIEDIAVEKGQTVTKPTDPTETGYEFKGWYTDEQYTTEYDFTQAVTGNLTLHAKWEAIEYSITYNGVEGATHTNPTSYTIESETINLTDATKTGYTFDGWYDAETGGTKVTQIAQGSTGDKVLYAHWTATEYTIEYKNLKEGTATSNPKKYTIETDTFSLSVPTPKPTGYTFEGWYDAEEGGNRVTGITKGSTGNKILYAHWTADSYNITYKDKGDVEFSGTFSGTFPTKHTYGTATTLVSPTKAGYTFGGWYKESDCSGTAITELGKTEVTGPITLYAKWDIETYSITYTNVEGATHTNPATYTVETETFNLNDASKLGYTFDGWFNAAGQKVTKIEKGSYGNLSLNAHWTVNKYTITYKDEGDVEFSGDLGTDTPLEHAYDTETILVAATKNGYNFEGWYLDKECTQSITKIDASKPEFAKNITLYAKWTKITRAGVVIGATVGGTVATGAVAAPTTLYLLKKKGIKIGKGKK